MSPADPDWVGLTVRQDELAARMKGRMDALWPAAAEAFYTGSDLLRADEEPFRRGFPFLVHDQTGPHDWTADLVREWAGQWAELFRTSTVRGLDVYHIPSARFGELLDALPAGGLRALDATPHADTEAGLADEVAAFARLLATHPAMTGVRHLVYPWGVEPVAATLAKATALAAVRRVELSVWESGTGFARLAKAAWFRRVAHARVRFATGVVVPDLARLPDLHTLDLDAAHPDAAPALARGRWPALARLLVGGRLDADTAAALARAKFPRLAAFAPRSGMKADALAELLRADWFAGLRSLDLHGNAVGDRGVAAVVAHPVAGSLRVLRVGENASGKLALTALARPGAFPHLMVLDLRAYRKRAATETHLLAFATNLAVPTLRHLDLQGWPLGDAGAVALAANPSLAGLTMLNLDGCGIGDRGAKAVVASPHLQNLVYLRMGGSPIRTGADALGDPGVMPRLGECWLTGTKIPPKSAARIKANLPYVLI
jgi:hypothetical protein